MELNREEIEYFVRGYVSGEIPDYQASAFTMAVLLNGMSARETADLALAMAHSGEMLDLSDITPVAVDKHSTGGVGDKTTLVAEPLVAACGLAVGKMSGRGLGFSGGTLDKMESIPGYRTNLSVEEFRAQMRRVGLVLTGQSGDLAPADGKLYALRDVTGTVPSMPLIASSIMSKKLAAGAQAIVLDVKVGLGAFMTELEQAQRLAELMVSIARQAGRKAVALLSDMNQPLGRAVGNAMELKEALETLQGGGPADFRLHCLTVAGYMLALGGYAGDVDAGHALAEQALVSGKGWAKFQELVAAQGGQVEYIQQPEKLAGARWIGPLRAERGGYLRQVNARVVGETAVRLGAGRAKKSDPIDYGVGILVHAKVGDEINTGQTLFEVHANDEARLKEAMEQLRGAIAWSDSPVEPLPLYYGVVG
ncbi:MAG: thymidine phosphorylase [Chloroflexi bacterium]|nr:thymidine phosphorylase [Chloroflexota bacterium]